MSQEPRAVIECPHCNKVQFARRICCISSCRKTLEGGRYVGLSPTKEEMLEDAIRVEPTVMFGDVLPTLAETEMTLIHEAIKRFGVATKAADHIGIGKTTIYRLLKEEKNKNDRASA